MKIDRNLPVIKKVVTQSQINQYAQASGDFNPVHIDSEFASTTDFGGTIAHGMLILAFLSQMMTIAFKEMWVNGGRLKIRFKSPVYPGDTVTTFGKYKESKTDEEGERLFYSIGCINQNSKDIIVGEASIAIN